MAAPKNPVIYLEAAEESTDESKESDEIRDTPVEGVQERKLSKGILGSCRKRYSHAHNYKQKARSSRMF